MFRPLHHLAPHYLHRRLTTQLRELYYAVIIQEFALAAIIIFEPVYLYRLGYSLERIMAYYIVVYVLYFFLMPLGGKFVARRGPERSIAVSTIMLVGYYLCLLFVPQAAVLFWLAPVFFALQKTFYWPAYHADFISSSDQGDRGTEYSALYASTTTMYILGPLFGGAMITFFGFPALFSMVIALIFLSNVPLFVTPVSRSPQPFSYIQSLLLPFRRQHRRSTIAYLAYGEQLILLVIWPIFIALYFQNFLTMGWAISIATAITALITLAIGKLIDRGRWRSTLRVGAILSAVVWLTRNFLRTIPAVFTSDTAGRIGQNITWVTVTDASYERAVAEKNVIQRGMMMEQGLALGKILIAVIVLVAGGWIGHFTAAFVAAGVLSLLYMVF